MDNRIVAVLIVFFLAASSSALSCGWFDLMVWSIPECNPITGSTEDCMSVCVHFSTTSSGEGKCYPDGGFLSWTCRTCPDRDDVYCSDYDFEWVCNLDPCHATGAAKCEWIVDYEYCSAGCAGRNSTEQCRGTAAAPTGCIPEYDSSGTMVKCLDCPRNFECNDYVDPQDCVINPCKVMSGCGWWDGSCVQDADGDGCPDEVDNCPAIANNPNGTMPNSFCDEGSVGCDQEGDACDDTDGDGMIDQYELDNAAEDWADPLNTDANANCIADGVERAFDPVINLLRRIAVGVGTVMMMYVAVGWLTADTPAKRDNSKKALMYIIAGLIIIAGGRGLVIYLLSYECTKPADIGRACNCNTPCPSAPSPDPDDGCPFIYSFNGSEYVLEHEGYPHSALPPWEDESYSVLENLEESSGEYKIRITEELVEDSFTDKVRLFVIGHEKKNKVYPDLDGGFHTTTNPVKPLSCFEEDGTECLEFMENDGVHWMSSVDDKNLRDSDGDDIIDEYDIEDLHDGIILSFPNPHLKSQAKLLLGVKGSGGVSHAWNEFQNSLGKLNAEKIARLSWHEPLKSALYKLRDREGVLNVRVWDGAVWVRQKAYGVGAGIIQENILVLNVPENDSIYIKLDSSTLAYEIDYAQVEFRLDGELLTREITPIKAESNTKYSESQILDYLLEDDGNYLNLTTGDYVELTFKEPENFEFEDKTIAVSIQGFFLVKPCSTSIISWDMMESTVKFIIDPTYGIRRTYPEFVRNKISNKDE